VKPPSAIPAESPDRRLKKWRRGWDLNPTLLRNLYDFIDKFDRFLKCLPLVFHRRAVRASARSKK
jgi:hypothetical protein